MTDILPPPADSSLEEIHDRSYVVKAYRKDERTIVLRGAVRDENRPVCTFPMIRNRCRCTT